ncbi:MAG: GNAT family N-acetyltransferase [Sphingomonas sp. SCN 67-18]|uniref:GNAT family N-acetyltransferase n=1 Tax=uncultured Sphingomonas sp. TaxID=158754 RepID=UPI00086A982B|nr:GNAT family N-acetyltransferase [Sphingomonas sp. SCN 67-18]ODU22130.1 MAG: GNAT family N-acetyltransferase [Sphingomonas sp. SCN 67-18]
MSHDALPTLKTERLVLRALRQTDADALHAVFSDPQTVQWWSSGPHSCLAQTRDYVAQNASSDDWPTWAITLDDDRAIGWVVLGRRRPGVSEIGYILHRAHHRQGLTREALCAVIDHAFHALGTRRLFADTDPDNAASIALLQSLGFTLEGRLRGEWETHIGVRDSLIWGLLAGEWRSA